MRGRVAVLDACVLYPAPLRSFLMYLALEDLYQAKWTETIHEEWMRNVRRDYPDTTEPQLLRIRDLMNAHVRDCLVTGFERLIPGLFLPDPDDRHVLAAAIRAGADVIVTANLTDFPANILNNFGVEAAHPDQFIVELFDDAPGRVCEAARRQRESLKSPPLSVDDYLAALGRQGLSQAVAALRQTAGLL